MNETFNITLNQVLMMFIFLLIGYVSNRKKLLNEGAGSVISNLLVWVFLPAMCFNTFSTKFDFESLSQNINYITIGIVIVLCEIALGFLLARFITKDKFERGVFAYTIISPNFGYFGYPLILAVFGEDMLYKSMMLMLASNITVYTLGFYILDPTKTRVSFKSLINPPIIAIVIGMIFGLLKIPMPKIVTTTLTNAQNCMAPMSMILAGFVLAYLPLNKAFINIKVYAILVVRMIAIPVFCAVVLMFLGFNKDMIVIASGMMAMPAGLNSIVVPSSKGLNASLGAQIALISNIAAVITVPIAFMLLMNI